ncbi:MAG: ATP-binding protein [Planctomycetaceae bacterium]|nr:ATP-binding protein [Planctomycetaceae bacterium]
MIQREHTNLIRQRLKKFPAVAILGPRQCGKTTLARQIGGAYFDLEQEGSRARLDAQWNKLMAGRELIILDEAQSAPAVFPRLRGAIDDRRTHNGRFLLLGSVSPALMKNVSESLAGRLAVVELSPFILPELPANRMDDLWLCGGYPQGGILDKAMFGPWQDSYLKVLIQRDLPAWGLPAKVKTTERLVRMLAALHGQILNASQLGAALALDNKTVAGYCDYLEGAFLIRRLQPYFANIHKRLVKSAKVFWRDSGLLHSLSGIGDIEQLFSQPWVGHSWEGFIIEQTLETLAAVGKRAQSFFFRTSDGYELDLVLDWGTTRWAIEIKLTSNPSTDMIARLNKTADMIAAERRILVCRTAQSIETDNLLVANPAAWLKKVVE